MAYDSRKRRDDASSNDGYLSPTYSKQFNPDSPSVSYIPATRSATNEEHGSRLSVDGSNRGGGRSRSSSTAYNPNSRSRGSIEDLDKEASRLGIHPDEKDRIWAEYVRGHRQKAEPSKYNGQYLRPEAPPIIRTTSNPGSPSEADRRRYSSNSSTSPRPDFGSFREPSRKDPPMTTIHPTSAPASKAERTYRPMAPSREPTEEEESVIDKQWGVVFDGSNPTPRLGQMLRGIANYIVSLRYAG
jgi:hypothetical protein